MGSAAADGAGTSVAASADGTGDAIGSDDPDASPLESAGTAAHVPVKRKGGGRKR